jgi:phosphate uptake regulator
MKRKVIRQGHNTLTLTLPIKWVKTQNINPGDELNIEIGDDQLIVTRSENPITKPLKEGSVFLDRNDLSSVRTSLGVLYRKGYDIINVNYNNDEIFKLIKDAIHHLIGFEIVEKKQGFCKIKSYLLEEKEDFIGTINKFFSTIKTSQKILREDYIKGEYNNLEELEEYRFSCWKQRDLAMRTVIKHNIYNEDNYAYIIIIWTVEKINRNYKRMYRILKENNLKYKKEILTLYDEVTDYIDEFYKGLIKKDITYFEKLHIEHDRLVSKIFEMSPRLKKDNLMVGYLLENVRRIHDLFGYLIMVSIN